MSGASTPPPATPAPRAPAPAPPAVSSPGASAPPPARAPRPRPAHGIGTHLRATAIFLVLTIFMAGFAYPLFVTAVASVLNPYGAGGSLIKDPNGTVVGSALVAQNTSVPYLFWSRPSLTDYNMTLGADTPPGPSDPALGQLINETINYSEAEGYAPGNGSLPYWFVCPSGSSIDPDLVPPAVLIQIPRVANASDLSIAFLTSFVNAHITQPVIPGVGVPYVDVLELDVALLPYEGR
jgi:potassium-transporting ATPase KdpC subunit